MSEEQPLKILMTEGASISARQILFDLGERHTIDIMDPSPICQCRPSKLRRSYFKVPPFVDDPKGWLQVLGKRLREGDYDVVVPPHDEVFLLSHVRETLEEMTRIAIPPIQAVEEIQSKIRFAEICRELGIPIPESKVINDPKELEDWTEWPRWLKLAYGSAGATVKLVHNREEAEAALKDFQDRGWWEPGVPFLMQKGATGEQGFVRALFDRGELKAYHCSVLRMRGVGGAAIAKVSVDHPSVGEHMAKLGKHLGWHGVLFCDYFYDEETETPYYIEANPRIGDSANATMSGNNLIQKWVDVKMGRDIEPHGEVQVGVRSHSKLLVLISKCLDGASRGDVLKEMKALKKKLGDYEGSLDENSRGDIDWPSELPYKYMSTRLVLDPGFARRYVQKMVRNYSLSEEAADKIRNIPEKDLVSALKGG